MDSFPLGAWKRVGTALRARRGQLGYGYSRREAFARDNGLRLSGKTLARLERAERDAYPDDTLALVETMYRLVPGTILRALRTGGELEALPLAAGGGRRDKERDEPAGDAGGDQGDRFRDDALERIRVMPGLSDAEKGHAIAAVMDLREKMTRARFTPEEQWYLENAPAAFAELIRRERARDAGAGDDLDVSGQSALPGFSTPVA